jgi:hypothetical protein
MSESRRAGDWVWVLVEEGQTGQANLLGQYDGKRGVHFIPFFSSKEAATQCLPLLHRAPEARYEAQAIQFEEVSRNAAEQGFELFLIDGRGSILEEIQPS